MADLIKRAWRSGWRVAAGGAIVLFMFATDSLAFETASAKISRAQFGTQWPFGVDSGVLRCENMQARLFPAQNVMPSAITFTTGAKTYALNGIARGHLTRRDWVDIVKSEEMWPFVDSKSPRRSLTPIIEAGLALCPRPR